MKSFLKQLRLLVLANLKTRYRNSITGFFWSFLQPLVLFGTQSLVFHLFLNIQIDQYPIYLFMGLIPWLFFSSSTDQSSGILTNQTELLQAYNFNAILLPLAVVLENSIHFILSFAVVLFYILLNTNYDLSLGTAFLLPVYFANLVLFTFSVALMVATAQIYKRDTKFLFNFFLTVLFYLTPIFYKIDMVPRPYQVYLMLNPLYWFTEGFRSLFIATEFSPIELLAIITLITLFFLVLTCLIWKRYKNEIRYRV